MYIETMEREEESSMPKEAAIMTPEQIAAFKRLVAPKEFDPSGIRNKYLNVPYGTLPQQILDIYLPDRGEGPFPLLLYVHGGGWSMGSKTLCALDCVIGALQFGYAVASVDYRLAPAAVFPEFLFDVKTAVRWARANADQYNLNPERFGMIGDSAGGHLTLMVGFTAGHPEYEGEQYGWAGVSSAVQAIVDMYGPTDLAADTNTWLAESGVPGLPPNPEGRSIYDTAFTKDHTMLKLISPISYVHKGIPPVMILQGTLDPVVPFQHSTALAEKIEKICGKDRAELHLYEDRSHSDPKFMTKENCLEVLRFFDRYLK
jgi:acetyl esterase/lipase